MRSGVDGGQRRRRWLVIAAGALALCVSRPSAADSPDARGQRVIGGDATRAVVVDDVSVERQLLLVERDRRSPALRLGSLTPGPFELHATISQLFGRGDLVDVVVTRGWKRGAATGFATTHYLVRTATRDVVCRFDGNSADGDGAAVQWTIAELRKLSDEPLRFEVGYASRQQTRTGADVPTRYTRYLVPPKSPCSVTR